MATIQKLFGHSIRWNILESGLYQTMLFGHQYALYHTLSTTEYGTVGTLFSLVYLAIAVFNFGLNSSISPFFLHAIQSKNAAYRILFLPSIVNAVLLTGIAMAGFFACYFLSTPVFLSHMTPLLCLLALSTLLTESLKKTVRTILHCAFKNTMTTAIEIATITSYISIIWTVHMLGHTINVYTLFTSMMVTSTVSLACLLKVAYHWYKGLPDSNMTTSIPTQRIVRHRLYSYGTQLTKMFFSANFLVPLFAWKFGIQYAAFLKFVSYLNYYIHTIMHKVFGVSLQSCFAAIKNESLDTKKQFFGSVTHYVYQLLYGIIIFCMINGFRIISLKHVSADQSVILTAYLFFIALLIENFLISYEELYQAEEKTGYISALNSIAIILTALIATTQIITQPTFFLLFFIIIRICTIIGIIVGAFYFWRIQINLKPHIQSTICFMLLSLFLLFMMS